MSTDLRFDQQLALAATNYSIRTIAKAHTEGRLHLRPAFQRNLVWNDEQKSYLVDSILRNLPIPEIYFQIDDVPGRDEDLLVVVDGQQRISTCIQFLLGQLRISGPDLSPDWQGRIYSELRPELQSQFSRYNLVVRQLPQLNEAEIREIFRRLNRVVEPLLPQELRHAAYGGPYIKLIEAIASYPTLQELRVFTAKDLRRRGNDELMAEIVHASLNGAFPNKKEGLDEGFRSYESHGLPDEVASNIRRRFGRVFDLLASVADTVRNTRFRNKSDFYSLTVFLLARAESLPLPVEGIDAFASNLTSLSDRINAFRRATLRGDDIEATTPEDALALKYMRAVERAASDRLNRIRRDEVLREWLGPSLASSQPRRLDESDEGWLGELEGLEDASEEELEAERLHLTSVLVKDC